MIMKKISVLLFILLAIACSSRQKEINKTKSRIDQSSSVDSAATSKKASAASAIKNESSDEVTNDECIEYDGQNGDTLSVKKYGPDGKLQSETKISGKGKAKFSNSRKQTHKSQSESKHESEAAELKLKVKKKAAESASNSSFQKHVKSSGISFWTYFWLILLLLIILVILYLNYRYKLFVRFKKYVTDRFSH